MAIVMIEAPGAVGAAEAGGVRATLAERAARAGQELVHIRCEDEAQLLERLARIDRGQADIILFDPGERTADPRRARTLASLDVPYIEVRGDGHDAASPRVAAGAGPRVAVVDGYAAQGYTLAMSMALERLGCAECENDFSVGT